MSKQFGGKLTEKLIERYSRSGNWKDGKFQNLENTTLDFSLKRMPMLLYRQIFESKNRIPLNGLPIVPFYKEKFLDAHGQTKMIWFGHSVILLRLNNKTILIDPMFGGNSAPSTPFRIRRFSENTLDIIDDLPPVDLILLTHDHYDHLDYDSIQKLKSKTKKYFVALGVARHLEAWGVETGLIREFDWWDQETWEGITITFTPSRHFSGRGLSDRFKSLWGGWVMNNGKENIYFSGDGGYGNHFREVGKRLGPFDFGMMECGQYNVNWHQIHMYPEETVQAALDAGVKNAMPVHWGGFALAQHHWKDPVQRFVKEADRLKVPVNVPPMGKIFTVTDIMNESWWDIYE